MDAQASSRMHLYSIRCICYTKKIMVPHIWNYFEDGNGKEEHDGVGAYIKTTL